MISTLPSASSGQQFRNRRAFLKFLAASPLFASLPARAWQTHTLDEILASPKDALDVMDFEAAARKALPPAHWGYMASGVDDNLTRDINHEAYRHIELRPRKLVDVSKISTSVELFGTTWDSPIFLCPVGAQGMFHADGEIGVARAAQTKKALQILSTVTSHSVEDVIKAREGLTKLQQQRRACSVRSSEYKPIFVMRVGSSISLISLCRTEDWRITTNHVRQEPKEQFLFRR